MRERYVGGETRKHNFCLWCVAMPLCLPFTLSYSCFLPPQSSHSCVFTPVISPSKLPGECGSRQTHDMLSWGSFSCLYHMFSSFVHAFSYVCQRPPILLPFSVALSLLLFLSWLFPSRVQLPVSRPQCLNSINSQRTLFASEYQSACVGVLYLCMQALSTLCKCVQVCNVLRCLHMSL